MSRTRRLSRIEPRMAIFGLISLSIFAVCRLIVLSSAFARNPDVGYFGVTFDLCITIPALYYVLVVRARRAPALTLIPLFVLCLTVARLIVPPAQRSFLHDVSLIEIPLEVVLFAAILVRVRRGIASAASEPDLIDQLRLVCRETLGNDRLASAVSIEVAAVYLGLFGWRLDEPKQEAVASTTFHRRSGWGSIVACLIVIIAFEGIGLHLLVQQWSHRAAWLFTSLDVWGVLWLVADYQAFRIRPFVVTEDRIHLRFGFRWSATIPRADVASVESLDPLEAERLRGARGYLRLAILDAPQYLITLRRPIVVRGVVGISKQVTRIGILPDDPAVIEAL